MSTRLHNTQVMSQKKRKTIKKRSILCIAGFFLILQKKQQCLFLFVFAKGSSLNTSQPLTLPNIHAEQTKTLINWYEIVVVDNIQHILAIIGSYSLVNIFLKIISKIYKYKIFLLSYDIILDILYVVHNYIHKQLIKLEQLQQIQHQFNPI